MPTSNRSPGTYGDDQSQGVGSCQMTVNKARRIAVNIAKLPELFPVEPTAARRAKRRRYRIMSDGDFLRSS